MALEDVLTVASDLAFGLRALRSQAHYDCLSGILPSPLRALAADQMAPGHLSNLGSFSPPSLNGGYDNLLHVIYFGYFGRSLKKWRAREDSNLRPPGS